MTDVYLEVGKKTVFACALDWPGWCRKGKTEQDALDALGAYADRYAVIARRARVAFKPGDLTVVDRVTGGATTDFGAPEKAIDADARAVPAAEAKRQVKLLKAAWAELDAIAAATPEHLLKGPRGGGRDRDKMLDHVAGSEAGYARLIGVKRKLESYQDTAGREELRAAVAEVLGAASDGGPLRERGWGSRYAARRFAWHVLDHLWEMQDKTPA
ncbi:MAG: hypothetical protein HOV79_32775 [Hamadaea sp.]|nr:hypothetical protein [Hamadaea sp.]